MDEAIRPEVLIARLAVPHEPWRLEAEARLVALGAAAVEPLLGALHHAEPAVRAHAARALARIGDSRGIFPVATLLGDEENRAAVAIAAEKALVAWGPAARTVLGQLAREGEERLRARAIRALGRSGGEESCEILEGLLEDPSPAVRTQAGCALLAVLGPRAIPRVSALLSDGDKWVRYSVAEALVELGCVRGRAALEDARGDPEEATSHIPYWADELLERVAELERLGQAIP